MAGQREHGRKIPDGARWDATCADLGAEPGAETRRPTRIARDAAETASGPRVTNLRPRVRDDDEHTPVTRPQNAAAPRLRGDTGETATVPRQTNGVLKTAAAAPPAPHAPTKAPTTRGRKTLPPETSILPAPPESPNLHDDDADPGSSGGQTRRRRTSTARPVRPEDAALVTRQTLILNALEIVGEDARVITAQVPALHNPTDVTIVDADLSPRAPVTLVPAGSLAPTPLWLQPRRPRQRSLLAGFVTCLITLGIILGVLQAASPIGLAQGGLSPFGLLAAQHASNSAAGQPTGPWDTQSGAMLGLGGGAGPGVKAPGSAGLPAGQNANNSGSNTNNPPPSSNAGISPPPVQPWPPRWAYMFVPGHYAFGMRLPSSGYYWWAFGQCTWWAQYKRQDENLRHMGNARFWAGSASARGYRIGRTPVAGATVVFQPGVEGAGGAGHVAHVEKVYPGGWFLISEMNFYWNGGGWGRVDYRFAYARSGVSFIY